jgi:hypothetical protein
MPDRPIHSDPVDTPEVPAKLVETLVGHYRAAPAVPAEIDRAILAEARAGYARRRRFWLAARAVGAASAAAAAIVLAVVAFRDRGTAPTGPVAATQGAVSPVPGDIDHSGRVDVLDAYALAKRVEAGGIPGRGEDVNGDGVLDRADVDRVAAMAVSVEAPAPGGVR